MNRPEVMRHLKPFFPVIALVAIALGPQAVRAQSAFARWSTGPVLVYINPQNTVVSSDTVESAVRSAIDAWNQVPASSFEYVYGGRVSDTGTAFDNRNVVIVRGQTQGSTGASTYTWLSGGTVVDSDIVLRVSSDVAVHGAARCAGATSLQSVATRELGFALGLELSPDWIDNLPNGCAAGRRGLGVSEAAALVALYPDTASERLPFAVTLLPAFAGEAPLAAEDSNAAADTPAPSSGTQTQATIIAKAGGSSPASADGSTSVPDSRGSRAGTVAAVTPAASPSRGSSAETHADGASSKAAGTTDTKAEASNPSVQVASSSSESNARATRATAATAAGPDSASTRARAPDATRASDQRVTAALQKGTELVDAEDDANEHASAGQAVGAPTTRLANNTARAAADTALSTATAPEARLTKTSVPEPPVESVAASTRRAEGAEFTVVSANDSNSRAAVSSEAAARPPLTSKSALRASRAFSQTHTTASQTPPVAAPGSAAQVGRIPLTAQAGHGVVSAAAPPTHRVTGRTTPGMKAAHRRTRAAAEKTPRKIRKPARRRWKRRHTPAAAALFRRGGRRY